MEERKYKELFLLFDRWISLRERSVWVSEYLNKRDIKQIGIYGLGILGKHLLFELQKSGIDIVFGIDKRNDKLMLDINFIDPFKGDEVPSVDLIIVTAVYDYVEIEKEICRFTEVPVISLREIIEDLEVG